MRRTGVAGTDTVSAIFMFGLFGLVVVGGCVPKQPTGDQAGEVTPTSEPGVVESFACAESSAFTIATLEPNPSVHPSAPCGLALELDQGQLAIRAVPLEGDGLVSATGLGERLALGTIPDDCGPALEFCELWGVHDELGPILLAAVRGPESEVPIQVHVGWVEGQQLVFAPSWYGASTIADHTRVGPAWVLAPFACDGELALRPSQRLPEVEGEQPSEALRTASGHYSFASGPPPGAPDGTPTIRPLTEFADARCRPVFSRLP